MNYPFQCLDAETYQLMKRLYREGTITDIIYQEIEDCQNPKSLLGILKKHFSIPYNDFGEKTWKKIRQGWYWDRNKKQVCTVFNQWQSIFIEKILINEGIYTKEECLNEILTSKQISSHISKLDEWGIIITMHTRKYCGYKTIYFINPKIIKSVKYGK